MSLRNYYLGCPGWGMKTWVGRLFPSGTKSTEFLAPLSEVRKSAPRRSTFWRVVEHVGVGVVAIVDDDVVYVRGIKRALARRDVPIELSTFTRGDDAVTALCGDMAVDIAIVDLRLPGLDGYEVCRQIKAAHPVTFVAIASAHLSAEARIAAIEAGADCAVAKPPRAAGIVRSGRSLRRVQERSLHRLRGVTYPWQRAR